MTKLKDELTRSTAGRNDGMMALLFGSIRGGLGISVTLVGMLMAASTGIVGATVVTMGLLSLPTMLRNNYSAPLATGTISASGTLGQIIPPSIILVLLGDVLANAYQQAQQKLGIFSPKTVTVSDLFVGALLPGLLQAAARNQARGFADMALKDFQIWLDRLEIQKDDGEITTLNLDQFSVVQTLENAG